MTTATATAPASTVPEPHVSDPSEWRLFGYGQRRRFAGRVYVLTTGHRMRELVEDEQGRMFTRCGKCAGSGFLPYFMGIDDGRCWTCMGNGVDDALKGGIAEAVKREKANYRAEQRRQAERDSIAAEKQNAAQAWAEQHPALAARLASIVPQGADWDGSPDLYDLAAKSVERALSDKQTAYAAHLVEQYDAWQAELARYQHAGERGEKVTVSGTVSVAMTVDGYWGPKLMLIVENDTTVVKMFTTAKWAYDVDTGDEVTVSGTVKQYDEYRGVPQTVLSSPTRL